MSVLGRKINDLFNPLLCSVYPCAWRWTPGLPQAQSLSLSGHDPARWPRQGPPLVGLNSKPEPIRRIGIWLLMPPERLRKETWSALAFQGPQRSVPKRSEELMEGSYKLPMAANHQPLGSSGARTLAGPGFKRIWSCTPSRVSAQPRFLLPVMYTKRCERPSSLQRDQARERGVPSHLAKPWPLLPRPLFPSPAHRKGCFLGGEKEHGGPAPSGAPQAEPEFRRGFPPSWVSPSSSLDFLLPRLDLELREGEGEKEGERERETDRHWSRGRKRDTGERQPHDYVTCSAQPPQMVLLKLGCQHPGGRWRWGCGMWWGGEEEPQNWSGFFFISSTLLKFGKVIMGWFLFLFCFFKLVTLLFK